MKKLLIAIIAAFAAITAPAQSWQTYTNCQLDSNTVAASASFLWGTNKMDVRMMRTVALCASGQGSGYSTNTGTFQFVASHDGTNYEVLPRFALTFNTYGTNIWSSSTNIDVSGYAYFKPYLCTSSATNSQTNVVFSVKSKNWPRN